ncbi:murein transglycosylase A [Polynucleobacter sp. AP-Jannik-300A-C4]|uniref:murein transglycosylase A n=1 Tax=Polynucleobacter sp. AP-Jannik-300A-C4 TaxID=2576928 RepID=UPI00352E85F6
MPPSTANKIMGYSSSKLAIMISISRLISRNTTSRILICSVFVISIVSLLTACSIPSTRGSGYRSSGNAPSPYNSPIASFQSASWQDLPGWQGDDLTQAWPAWLKSCDGLRKRGSEINWRQVCAQANNVSGRDGRAIRQYFEGNFQVYEVRNNATGKDSGLITGYYEPVMNGSQTRTATYTVPLYGLPKAWRGSKPNPAPARAELMSSGVLKGSEIAWVQDPVAAAFMQIQGSGKIRLEDGRVLRLGYAGTNDQPFKSFAQWLLDRKEINRSQATMQGISAWAKRNPGQVEEMLNANPRFVFFKELQGNVSADLGPNGALGVPLTAERSIAIDLKAMPLGAPVFLSTTRPLSSQTLQKLVMAQDTGKAIVGGVRADYYWGSGDAAGELAGRMKQDGKMWLLLPR